MALVLRTGPYVGDHEDVLAFLTSASLSLTLLAGLTKITDAKARKVVSADDLIREATLGWILITVNTIPMVYFISINLGRCIFRRRIRVQRRKTRRIKEKDLQQSVALLGAENTAAGAEKAAAKARAGLDNSLVKILPASDKKTAKDNVEEHADNVMKGYHKHERQLAESQNRRKEISARKTQLRLLARNKLKSSRALSKVPAFAHLSEMAISMIVDSMAYESFPEGAVLCREGDVADCMYVIISGGCRVTSERSKLVRHGKVLAILKDLDIVGESMMCKEESQRVRIATVAACSLVTDGDEGAREKGKAAKDKKETHKFSRVSSWRRSGVTVLTLNRSVFEKFVHSGVVGFQDFARMRSSILSTGASRRSQNKDAFVAAQALRKMRGQTPIDVSTLRAGSPAPRAAGARRLGPGEAIRVWRNEEKMEEEKEFGSTTRNDEPH